MAVKWVLSTSGDKAAAALTTYSDGAARCFSDGLARICSCLPSENVVM